MSTHANRAGQNSKKHTPQRLFGAGQRLFRSKRQDTWIRPFFKQYRGALILALCLGVLAFVFSSALMFSSGYLISKAAEAPGNIMVIFVPLALVRIFGVGKPILRYFERLTSHNWVLRMTSHLRLKLYQVLEKDAIFLKQRIKTGDVLGLLAEDIGHIQNLYLRSIFPLVTAWALCVIVLIFLGYFSLFFALYMALLLGVVVVLVPLVSALCGGARRAKRKLINSELYEQLTDDVLGVSDWIISGRGAEYAKRYTTTEASLREIDGQLKRSARVRDLILQLLYGIALVSILVWAGSQFGGAYAGAANWIAAFVLAFFPLIEAFAPLSDAAIEKQQHQDAIDNLSELPQTLQSSESRTVTERRPQAPFTVNAAGLSFSYPNTTKQVLDGIDLTIKPGEKLAILGRSGAGKSTLASLIRGDLVPSSGSVTINGVPTSELGDAITDYLGVIQQQTYLFNASLAENLRIARAKATDEELWEALEKVELRHLVERLPEGLDTLADEAGLRFSGGERHRFALARVLLHQAPIIILDEPTVGLDPLSEQALLDTLFTTLESKTVIMITHHLQGISLMDRVVFIEEGSFKIEGSPRELAKTNAYYQELQDFDRGISLK